MAYRDKIRRLCRNTMFLALCLLLSYLEAALPLNIWLPLPGFKLGLSNIIITLIFVLFSPWDAMAVSLCRISLMGLLFGNLSSFTFSLCGGVLSYSGLWLLARLGKRIFSMIGVGVGCAALHNLGQLLMAAAWLGMDLILGYLPMLLLAALLFGTASGIMLQILLPRIEKFKNNKINI